MAAGFRPGPLRDSTQTLHSGVYIYIYAKSTIGHLTFVFKVQFVTLELTSSCRFSRPPLRPCVWRIYIYAKRLPEGLRSPSVTAPYHKAAPTVYIRIDIYTSKTPAGRHATEGHHTSVTTKRDTVSRSKEGCFPLGYVGVSSDANSFPNRFRSSSYVDPGCSNPHIMLDTDHPMQRDRSVTGRHGRPAGHLFPGLHSNGQPSVATIATKR